MMAFAPVTVQNMPDRLRREPMTVLQPASITPEPMNKVLASEFWIAHALGVALEVSGLDSDGVCNRGSAAIDASEKLYQLFDIAAVGFGLVTEDPLLLSRHVAGVE